jgi:hypothetical protein
MLLAPVTKQVNRHSSVVETLQVEAMRTRYAAELRKYALAAWKKG